MSIVVVITLCSALSFEKTAVADDGKVAAAEKLNSEGKKLIGELDLEGAAAKFREAIGLVEDPRYAFNLCYTLEKSGGLEEAKRACTWVTGSTDKRLAKKAVVLLKRVETKLAANPSPPDTSPPDTSPPDSGPPDPGPPDTSPPNPGPPAGVEPPTASPPAGGYPPPMSGSLPPANPPPFAPPKMAKPEKTKGNRFGVRVGLTNSFTEGLGEDVRFAGMLGAMYSRSFGSSFQLLWEAQVAGRGSELVTGDIFDNRAEVELVLTYFDFSTTSRYTLGSGRIQGFLDVGSSLSFLLSSDTTDLGIGGNTPSPSVNLLDLSFNVGGGVLMGPLELRILYMRGLLDISGNSNGVFSRSTLFEVGYWF